MGCPRMDEGLMRLRLGILSVGILSTILAAGGVLHAQPATPPDQRVIPLTVIDRDGLPIAGLVADQVRIRGIKADWTLSPATHPRRVLIVADAHIRGGDPERWLRTKKFLRQFLLAVKDRMELALWTLPGESVTSVSFAADPEAVWSRIASVPDEGITTASSHEADRGPLMETISSVVTAQLEPGDAILLVAGCVVLDYKLPQNTRRLLADRGVRIFLFNAAAPIRFPDSGIISPDLPVNLKWEACPLLSTDFYGETGGAALSLLSPPFYSEPGPVFVVPANFYQEVARRMFNQIDQIYLLQLRPKEPLRKRKELRIDIVDKDLRNQRKPKVLFPKYLYPH